MAEIIHVPSARQGRSGSPQRATAWKRLAIALVAIALFLQAAVVVEASPREFFAGLAGMADMLRRSVPPAFGELEGVLWPALVTIDAAVFGTIAAVIVALPLAAFAARNITPSRGLYLASRAVITLCRAVPDLIWALLFVGAVGLGPFPGALALAVHSIGMLGRLFSEVIEDMHMGPVEALTVAGASRLQIFSHAVLPSVLPSVLGIGLYRFDENIRSSLVLGFVGAGGIGFQIISAMSLFDYRKVALLLIVIFVIVFVAERCSAAIRAKTQ